MSMVSEHLTCRQSGTYYDDFFHAKLYSIAPKIKQAVKRKFDNPKDGDKVIKSILPVKLDELLQLKKNKK